MLRKIFSLLTIVVVAALSSSLSAAENPSDSKFADIKKVGLKDAREATASDIEFLPFSGWFKAIRPQIEELAKCDAALTLSDKAGDAAAMEMLNRLRQNLLKVLPAAEPGANLYDLEIEYNRMWWARKGYFEGISKLGHTTVEQVANLQLAECLKGQ